MIHTPARPSVWLPVRVALTAITYKPDTHPSNPSMPPRKRKANDGSDPPDPGGTVKKRKKSTPRPKKPKEQEDPDVGEEKQKGGKKTEKLHRVVKFLLQGRQVRPGDAALRPANDTKRALKLLRSDEEILLKLKEIASEYKESVERRGTDSNPERKSLDQLYADTIAEIKEIHGDNLECSVFADSFNKTVDAVSLCRASLGRMLELNWRQHFEDGKSPQDLPKIDQNFLHNCLKSIWSNGNGNNATTNAMFKAFEAQLKIPAEYFDEKLKLERALNEEAREYEVKLKTKIKGLTLEKARLYLTIQALKKFQATDLYQSTKVKAIELHRHWNVKRGELVKDRDSKYKTRSKSAEAMKQWEKARDAAKKHPQRGVASFRFAPKEVKWLATHLSFGRLTADADGKKKVGKKDVIIPLIPEKLEPRLKELGIFDDVEKLAKEVLDVVRKLINDKGLDDLSFETILEKRKILTDTEPVRSIATAALGAKSLKVNSAEGLSKGQLIEGQGIPAETYVGYKYRKDSTNVPITNATTATITDEPVVFKSVTAVNFNWNSTLALLHHFNQAFEEQRDARDDLYRDIDALLFSSYLRVFCELETEFFLKSHPMDSNQKRVFAGFRPKTSNEQVDDEQLLAGMLDTVSDDAPIRQSATIGLAKALVDSPTELSQEQIQLPVVKYVQAELEKVKKNDVANDVGKLKTLIDKQLARNRELELQTKNNVSGPISRDARYQWMTRKASSRASKEEKTARENVWTSKTVLQHKAEPFCLFPMPKTQKLHITFGTQALWEVCQSVVPWILGRGRKNEVKIWDAVLDKRKLETKYDLPPGKDNKVNDKLFDYRVWWEHMKTDGESASVVLVRPKRFLMDPVSGKLPDVVVHENDQRRRKRDRRFYDATIQTMDKSKSNDDEEDVAAPEEIFLQELQAKATSKISPAVIEVRSMYKEDDDIVGKWFWFVDPGRKNLFTASGGIVVKKQDGSLDLQSPRPRLQPAPGPNLPEPPPLPSFRLTNNEWYVITGHNRRRKKEIRLREKASKVSEAMLVPPHKVASLDGFKTFCDHMARNTQVLYDYSKEKSVLRLRMDAYIAKKRCINKWAEQFNPILHGYSQGIDLRDVHIVIGDGNFKHNSRGVKTGMSVLLIQELKMHGFVVIEGMRESGSSQITPCCNATYQRARNNGFWSVGKCSDCNKWWNRDFAAAQNMSKRFLHEWIKGQAPSVYDDFQ
jgi:hypothetical protein